MANDELHLETTGYKVGLIREQEWAAAIRAGLRPVWLPEDPRYAHLFFMSSDGDRDATPEEAADSLREAQEILERKGLAFAEPGDPDGFMVKWMHKQPKA